jgi:hypothetical protein
MGESSNKKKKKQHKTKAMIHGPQQLCLVGADQQIAD